MHPPRILVWGGTIKGGTFEFDAPDSAIDDQPMPQTNSFSGAFRGGSRRQGKRSMYFLKL